MRELACGWYAATFLKASLSHHVYVSFNVHLRGCLPCQL